MIAQHQCRHGLNDGNSSWKHARIMPSFGFKHRRVSLAIDRLLLFLDCRSRLERDAKDDGHAVGDTALHSAGVVGQRLYGFADSYECIVMLASLHPGS